jgi:hypothetical protein
LESEFWEDGLDKGNEGIPEIAFNEIVKTNCKSKPHTRHKNKRKTPRARKPDIKIQDR